MAAELFPALTAAIRARALHDLQESIASARTSRHRAASRLALVHDRLHQEIDAYASGRADRENLTPLQRRLDAAAEQAREQVSALLVSLREPQSPDATAAAETLVGTLLGTTLALEARMAALEAMVVGD